jgi:hypothetical protein
MPVSSRTLRRLTGTALLSAALTAPLAAQLERIDVPKGAVRIDIYGAFTNAGARFNDGTVESLLGPPVAPLIGAEMETNFTTMGVGAALGLLPGLTVYGRVPFVRQRIRAVLTDSTADTRIDTTFTSMGDIEFGASYALLDRWDRDEGLGGIRLGVSAQARLPTGQPKDPYDPLDIGTGTGQTDVSLGAVFDWGAGRWGARLTGSYTLRSGATVERPVRSPREPTNFAAPITVVTWSPGSVVQLGARPFFRLAPAIALQAGVIYRRHAVDDFQYASPADAIPGLDPAIMADGTQRDMVIIGGGISYSSPSASDPLGKGLPIEATWTYEQVVSSGTGVVPKNIIVRGGIRLYFNLWGPPPAR